LGVLAVFVRRRERVIVLPPFLLIFLLREQQKIGTFVLLRSGLGACCLTILIFLRVLNVLRMPPPHATRAFPDFKVSVYRRKGECLQEKR